MPEANTPITTATAAVKVNPDKGDWDQFKRDAEKDIDSLGDRLAATFKKAIDDFKDMLKAVEMPTFQAPQRDQVTAAPSPSQSAPPVADQTLTKLTDLKQAIDDNSVLLQQILEAIQQQGT